MFSIPNILLGITAACNIGLALFINAHDTKNKNSYFFALFTVFLSLWASALIMYSVVDGPLFSIYLMKGSYVAALLIGVSFYFFSIYYPENRDPHPVHKIVVAAAALLFIVPLMLLEDFFTKEIVVHTWGKETTLGIPEYLAFVLLFVALFVGGLIRIWIKYLRHTGIQRIQLLFIGASVTIAGISGMYFNLLLPSPFIQDFRFIWSGPLFTFFIAITITYSVFRLRLFNIKVVAAEFFTFLLWIFILVQLFIASDLTQFITNLIVFAATIIIGLFLIRSVNKEVETREKVEKLADDLEKANERLTELDIMKSEFVSVASHQLRSPLTAIRGYASMLLEGSFGKLTKKSSEAIERIQDSSRYMALSVEDYLNVSRIEAGNMKYEYSTFDLHEETETVVSEVRPTAEDKGLALDFVSKCTGSCVVRADIGKTRQVLQNLIDNAMKYTKQGTITVTVHDNVSKKEILVSVTDTGVGMSAETLTNMFQKFVRAKNANSVNVSGTGLGLFIAKRMIDDMSGRLWAESDGEGKGSTFHAALPMAE